MDKRGRENILDVDLDDYLAWEESESRYYSELADAQYTRGVAEKGALNVELAEKALEEVRFEDKSAASDDEDDGLNLEEIQCADSLTQLESDSEETDDELDVAPKKPLSVKGVNDIDKLIVDEFSTMEVCCSFDYHILIV